MFHDYAAPRTRADECVRRYTDIAGGGTCSPGRIRPGRPQAVADLDMSRRCVNPRDRSCADEQIARFRISFYYPEECPPSPTTPISIPKASG